MKLYFVIKYAYFRIIHLFLSIRVFVFVYVLCHDTKKKLYAPLKKNMAIDQISIKDRNYPVYNF